MAGQYPELAAALRRGLQKGDKGEVRGELLPIARSGDGSIGPAIPQMLRHAGVGLLDLMSYKDTGKFTPEAQEFMIGMTPAGGATAMVRPSAVGSLGIFGGRLAKTADPEKLKRAEVLAELGADRRKIWDETGWFQGADGKWRFEIDDSQAKLTDWQKDVHGQSNIAWPGRDGPPQEMSAPDWMSHPELEQAYWPTREQSPGVLYDETKGLKAYYRPKEDTITMGNRTLIDDADKGRSTGLHELTHAVQHREGFATGGNQTTVVGDELQALHNRKIELWHAIANTPEQVARDKWWNLPAQRNGRPRIEDYPGPVTKEMAEFDALSEAVDQTVKRGYETYPRLAGETEARNVQTRRDMTPEQRRASPPWETQDVPDDQQIVRFATGGPQMMASVLEKGGKGDIADPQKLAAALAGNAGKAGVKSDAMKVSPDIVRAAEDAGLPLNPDGTVTLYHGTSKEAAEAIRKSGQLRSEAEPDIYFTTEPDASKTGYGEASIAVDLDPRLLQIDDEFPDGRRDFRINAPNKVLKARVRE